MNLVDLVSQIEMLDEDLTIYARAPWQPDSEAICAQEPTGSLVPADLASSGFSYFLEVFIAREFLEDLSSSGELSIEKQCVRLIQYAVNDA